MKDKILSALAILLLVGFMSLPSADGHPVENRQLDWYSSSIHWDSIPKLDTIVIHKRILDSEPKKSKLHKYHQVLATKYNPTKAQCDSDPFVTADLSKINKSKLKSHKLKWIAVSRDLLPEYPYGSTVKIESSNPKLNGYWKVHDTMHSRHRYRIDFLVPSNDKYDFHKPLLVKMYKV